MCPSRPSIPSSAPGLKLSMSDPRVKDCIRELLAHTDLLESKGSSFVDVSGSFGGNCLLPLNGSQSHLLAHLVTISVPRLTWWSTKEDKDSWVLCGRLGEDSGPQVTVFITATSDRNVIA